MSTEGNRTKNRLLGMPYGTATGRLRKMILFDLLRQFDFDHCFRCDQQIASIDDLSIEHITPWQGADDPKVAFFDLENIAFSHLRCNIQASEPANAKKDHCPKGHPYDDQNTVIRPNGQRGCLQCHRDSSNAWQKRNRRRRSDYERMRYNRKH